MKKPTRLQPEVIVAILLPAVVYGTQWLARGRQAPLYITPPWDAPLPIYVFVAMLPFVYLVVAAGALGFGVLRKKRAVAAAIGASFLTLALFDLAPIAGVQISYPLAMTLAAVAGGLSFYMAYRVLSRTKWLKTAGVLTVTLGYALFILASIATLYYVRVGFGL